MKILALDSSSLTASIAIVEDDITVAEYTVNYKKTHSQTLLPMLDEIVSMTEQDLNTLDAIAVASGPGSFTGLRIGSATVKGLAEALQKPIVPVPTVDGLAGNLYGTDKLVCPLMDARRGQTYSGLYEYIKKEDVYELHCIKKQCAADTSEMIQAVNELGREVVFLGDGVPVFRDILKERIKVPYSFAPNTCNRQRAAVIGWLGLQLFKQGIFESAVSHAPEYLRLSQAERERNQKLIIREMALPDIEQVCALEEMAFSMPWHYQSFAEVLENKDALYLVVEEDFKPGVIIACCGVRGIVGEGNISNVVVHPDYRRRGIARRMLTELMRRGQADLGIESYTLEVRKGNTAAISLYRYLGFSEEGIRKNFYEKPVEDAVIMWKRQVTDADISTCV